MTVDGARDAINASALMVGGIYLYRRLIETPSPSSSGAAAPAAGGAQAVPTANHGPQPTGISTIPAQLMGAGPVAPLTRFVVGWGFVYMVLSLMVDRSAQIAGGLATLIAGGAILGNGQKVAADIQGQLNAPAGPSGKLGAAGASNTSPTVPISYTLNPATLLGLGATTTPTPQAPPTSGGSGGTHRGHSHGGGGGGGGTGNPTPTTPT